MARRTAKPKSKKHVEAITHEEAHRGYACRELAHGRNEDRWLSMKEICKHLGVSDDTVYKWFNSHDMPAQPAHRLGLLWKFKKDEVSR